MRAYKISKASEIPIEEKIVLIKGYEVGDLLYVLRDIEKHPSNYDEIIVSEIVERLYDMGIMCM